MTALMTALRGADLIRRLTLATALCVAALAVFGLGAGMTAFAGLFGSKGPASAPRPGARPAARRRRARSAGSGTADRLRDLPRRLHDCADAGGGAAERRARGAARRGARLRRPGLAGGHADAVVAVALVGGGAHRLDARPRPVGDRHGARDEAARLPGRRAPVRRRAARRLRGHDRRAPSSRRARSGRGRHRGRGSQLRSPLPGVRLRLGRQRPARGNVRPAEPAGRVLRDGRTDRRGLAPRSANAARSRRCRPSRCSACSSPCCCRSRAAAGSAPSPRSSTYSSRSRRPGACCLRSPCP